MFHTVGQCFSMISCSVHVPFSQIVLRLKNMADLDLSKSLSQTNFGNPGLIKDLLTSPINRVEQQDSTISYLKSENDHVLSENSVIKDRVLKLERYSSVMFNFSWTTNRRRPVSWCFGYYTKCAQSEYQPGRFSGLPLPS